MKVDLFFCGDSNTFGEELQGQENDHQKRIDQRYSTLVSEELGKTHENISKSGACNDWIVKTVVEWFEAGNKCDAAIIQFSAATRWGWYDEDGQYHNIGSKDTTDNLFTQEMEYAHSSYYESIWSEQLSLDNYWKNMFFLKNYLKGKCNVIWMTLARIPRGTGVDYNNNKWQQLCADIEIGEQKWIVDGNKCVSYEDKVNGNKLVGSHPNALGHMNIANWVISRL